jgi:hypothetical protein
MFFEMEAFVEYRPLSENPLKGNEFPANFK